MPHVLITTDAVGGVGSHTRELAQSLVRRRWRVTVAVFGPLPGNGTMSWARDCGVEVRHGGPGLEWMPGAESAVREGQRWLRAQIADLRPDVLHANQFAAAGAGGGVPVLLAVHSDVLSWWRAVHGHRPPQGPWIRFYERTARAGLAAAAVVVAPTRAALADLRASFGAALDRVPLTAVIANGMDLAAWPRPVERRKRGYAAAAGRLWDEGKQIHLVCQPGLAMPMKIAGPGAPPTAGAAARDISPGARSLPAGVSWAGELDPGAMKDFLAGAAVFVLPSRYEPFGLVALEAALSGCALLLNDIPALREVWGEAAAYFDGNASVLAAALAALAASPRRRRALADSAAERACVRYGATRMAEQYAGIYTRLMGRAGERALSKAGATAPSLPASLPPAARNSPALARNPM